VESLADGGRRGTLLDVLDHTRTAMGARRLREWILRPLVELERIQDRLDAVEELAFRALDRGRLRETLSGVQDLDRILGRVTLGTAGPRDLVALSASLRALPAAGEALGECVAPLLRREVKELDPPTDVADEIARTLVDDPPALAARAASCARASTPGSTSCAPRAGAAGPPSPRSRSASGRAPGSPP